MLRLSDDRPSQGPHAPPPTTSAVAAVAPARPATGQHAHPAGGRPGSTGQRTQPGRRETAEQRADRNFHELLQELRVAQTGVQILFAFLLIFPLQPLFRELDAGQRVAYLLALALCATAACLLIAPAAYHRVIFRRGLKEQLVRVASRFAMTGLVFLLGSMVTGVDLVVSIVAGPAAGAIAAGVLACGAGATWFAVPMLHRRGFPRM